jgi:hypothetical protein
MRVPWNKGKKGLQVAWNKGKTMPSRPCTEERKQKLRDTMTGRTYSEERRAAMRGPRKPLSPTHREAISRSMQKYLASLSDEEFVQRMKNTTGLPETQCSPLDPIIIAKINVALGI